MSNKIKEPEFYYSQINTKLINYNVYRMPLKQKVMYFIGLFGAGGVLGMIFYGGLFKSDGEITKATKISNLIIFCLMGIIIAKIFMPIMNERLRNKRLKNLKVQFKDFLSSVSAAMAGGMNIGDSILSAYNDMSSQYSEDSYIALEIMEMINGMQNNIPIEDTIKNLGMRSGIDEINNFGIVFSVCYRTGGNMKEVVKNTTRVITEKMIIEDEIDTKIMSNKIQLYTMLGIPVVIMVLMKSMSSDFAEGFASIVGVIATTISIFIFIGAYKFGSKIMKI